jgi:hypothetical protein
MFISSVVDPNLCHGFSLIGGVIVTSVKFITGVIDTAEK